jgi:enterochelin esterase-like enzyme
MTRTGAISSFLASPAVISGKEMHTDLFKITLNSQILKKNMKLNLYLPAGCSQQSAYPVLFMVHGYGANEDCWMPWLEIDKRADKLAKAGKIRPMIIVCPDLENSYGINSSQVYGTLGGDSRNGNLSQGRFEDYLCQELIPFIDAHCPTDGRKENRFIGGLSMGGFAATHIAFRHPDFFSKVGGHSPALFLDSFPLKIDRWLYPSRAQRAGRDPVFIAQTADLSGLSVYLDCGDEDCYAFYNGCKKLQQILQARNVSAQFHLNPGKHDRDYWLSHVEDYLQFYAEKK